MASTLGDRELLFEALAIHLGFASRRAIDEVRKSLAGRHDEATAPGLTQPWSTIRFSRQSEPPCRASGRRSPGPTRGEAAVCLDSLSAFGRLRHDLERRLASLESRHPTVPPSAAGKEGHEIGTRDGNGTSVSTTALSQPALPIGRDEDEDEDEEDGQTEGGEEEFSWSLGTPGSAQSRFEVLHAHARGGSAWSRWLRHRAPVRGGSQADQGRERR